MEWNILEKFGPCDSAVYRFTVENNVKIKEIKDIQFLFIKTRTYILIVDHFVNVTINTI